MASKDNRITNGYKWRQLRKYVKFNYKYCALCGQEIDWQADYRHPLAGQIYHITPISKGGAIYDINNIQGVHRYCNILKSNDSDDVTADKMIERIKDKDLKDKLKAITFNKEYNKQKDTKQKDKAVKIKGKYYHSRNFELPSSRNWFKCN